MREMKDDEIRRNWIHKTQGLLGRLADSDLVSFLFKTGKKRRGRFSIDQQKKFLFSNCSARMLSFPPGFALPPNL
jgi:hypothetical protein